MFTSARHNQPVQVFLHSYWTCRSIRNSVTRSSHRQSEVAVVQFTYHASGLRQQQQQQPVSRRGNLEFDAFDTLTWHTAAGRNASLLSDQTGDLFRYAMLSLTLLEARRRRPPGVLALRILCPEQQASVPSTPVTRLRAGYHLLTTTLASSYTRPPSVSSSILNLNGL